MNMNLNLTPIFYTFIVIFLIIISIAINWDKVPKEVTYAIIFENVKNICIILLPLLIFSIWLIRHKVIYSATTNATILSSECSRTGKNNDSIECIITVKYTANNVDYISPQISANGLYSTGQVISIRYNPNKASDITITSLSSHSVGIIIFIIDALLIGSSLIWTVRNLIRLNSTSTVNQTVNPTVNSTNTVNQSVNQSVNQTVNPNYKIK